MESPLVSNGSRQEMSPHQTAATQPQDPTQASRLPPTDRVWEPLLCFERPPTANQIGAAQALGCDHTTVQPTKGAVYTEPRSPELAHNSFVSPYALALDAIMQQIITAVATVVPSEAGSIILFEQAQGRIAYTRGFAPAATAFFQTYRFALNELVPAGVTAKARPYLVSDTWTWPDWIPLAVTAWVRSSIGVPIALRGQNIGLLVLDSATPHHFQPTDVDKLQAFVLGASLALAHIGDVHLGEEQEAQRAELQATKTQVELLRTLIDAMPDPIYIKDRQHRFVLRNQNPGHSLHSMHPQQAIGKTDSAFYAPALAEAFRLEEETIFQTGQPLLRHEMPVVREDGSAVWIAVTKVPLRNPQGEIIGLAGFSYDITQRKASEEALRASEARYRLLADNITDMVCRLKLSLECLYVSPSSLLILGYTSAEIIGQSALSFIHPADFPIVQQVAQQALAQDETIASVRIRLRHKQGYYIWSEISGRALFAPENGEPIEFVVSARDVTKQKQAEDALQEALQKAQELNELKSRFVSMASHEFRTPLTSILLMTETLRAYRHKLTAAQIDQRLNTIGKQVEYLKTIIEDVLELTCIQAHRVEFNFSPIDLDALCRTIIDELQAQTEHAPRLLYQCDNVIPTARLDKRLMRQMLTNLVTNAIKYSSNGTPVRVRLLYTGTALLLQVEDTGIGIPEFDLPYLFQPFHRASNVGAIAGTGLGLVITKEAVELHGGTINVTSQVDVGTTFTVTLPITPIH